MYRNMQHGICMARAALCALPTRTSLYQHTKNFKSNYARLNWHKCSDFKTYDLVYISERLLTTSSFYFGKAEKSGKKGNLKSKMKVVLNPLELNQVISYDEFAQQMEATIEHLRQDYANQLSLKTSRSTIDKLIVETSDGNFPLMELAPIVQKNRQLLIVNVASCPQYLNNIHSALSAYGVSFEKDGTTIYVTLQTVSVEQRHALAKTAKQLCEKAKEKMRNIQNNHCKDLRKAKGLHSDDLIFNVNETLLNKTKEYIQKAESVLSEKQKEILGN